MSSDLQNYIQTQLEQGHSIEDITKTLLHHGHTLEGIAKASVNPKEMNFEAKPKKSFLSFLGKLIWWIILIGLGIALGVYLTLTEIITPYLPSKFQNLQTNSTPGEQLVKAVTPDDQLESTDSAEMADSSECNDYVVLGYFDGLADSQDSLEQIPQSCMSQYDNGFNQAVQEANQTSVEFSDVDRDEDLQVIVDLIYEYDSKDTTEDIFSLITDQPQEIGLGTDKLDLVSLLIDLYESQPGDQRIFPYDPERGSLGSSQYFVYIDERDRLVVETVSEDDENIKLARVQ